MNREAETGRRVAIYSIYHFASHIEIYSGVIRERNNTRNIARVN